MKVIVADKISARGVQLLKEQPGWNVVLTTKDNLVAEIADAQYREPFGEIFTAEVSRSRSG